jgi:K+-sensing histidine kinase KdpD
MRRMDAVPHSGLFYLPGGVIAAVVLGMALAPLRELTNAGNFVFAFVILIIVVGELGGRAAAVATAACSALSLDFFLTKPYLSLKIEEKHDLVAFLGLALCGLVAAALGSRRSGAAGGGEPDPSGRAR